MFDLTSKNWTCFYWVQVRFVVPPEHYSDKAAKERRRLERDKIKEAGFEEKDLKFHFKHLDAAVIKSAAKKKARAAARRVTRRTGVIVEVVEGSYL